MSFEVPRLASAVTFSMMLATSCEDDGARCKNELCDPATHGAVCVGHAIQTCAADGKSFAYEACGDQQRCDAGACVGRACTNLGVSRCVSVTRFERCLDDGSEEEQVDCASDEVCKDGACVKSVCQGEPDRCTNGGFVTCTDAAWVQENCPVGDFCTVADDGAGRCTPSPCAPESRRCDGGTVHICDARGASETVIACDKGDVCIAGVCQAAVCGGGGVTDVSEVTDADASETAEPESKVIFTLNGVVNEFDISALARFDTGDNQVTVIASKAQRRFEMRIAPAAATVSGEFSSDLFNPTKVIVCYDAGGAPGPFEEHCVDFTHESVAYDVNITRNDGEGGRFEASFEATLQDANTDTIVLESGQINVKYR